MWCWAIDGHGGAHRKLHVFSMMPASLAMALSSVRASFTAARASLTASIL